MTSSERGLQTLREAGVEGVVANALDAQAVHVAMNKARPDAVIEENAKIMTSRSLTLYNIEYGNFETRKIADQVQTPGIGPVSE